MATMNVVNWKNEKVGQVDLNDGVFADEVRKDVLHTLVKWQLASRRRGTHSTKTRTEVSGGGRKPFKQKGTGNARQGSTRSPLQAGGAVIFGPKPRDYSYNLPSKVRKKGLRSALSYLNKEGKLFVLDDLENSSGKTKELNQKLQNFGLKKALLVDQKGNDGLKRSARNMAHFKCLDVEGLNVFDLLKYDAALISQSCLDKITERCGVGS